MVSNNADARLEFAMQQAIKNGDILSFMEAVTSQYDRILRRGGPVGDRAALRTALSEQVDKLRAPLRSRVGRLWAGDMVDRAYGPILRDLMAQPEPDPGEALRIAEGAKARTLLDWMSGYFAELPEKVSTQALDVESALTRFAEDQEK
jgi:hypothetical protein